jgi:glycosyltransferase involved in cell wall biosynthesis
LFVGESDNVGYWFDKMDIFVLLSRFEGLPNVLIEAQMCGVPVVSTPAGSAEDTFLNGETGFLLPDVENPDIDEIVEGVELVSNTMAGRPEICARASDRAMEIFSVSSMIKGTVSHLVLY